MARNKCLQCGKSVRVRRAYCSVECVFAAYRVVDDDKVPTVVLASKWTCSACGKPPVSRIDAAQHYCIYCKVWD